jgi:hypothetical protein
MAASDGRTSGGRLDPSELPSCPNIPEAATEEELAKDKFGPTRRLLLSCGRSFIDVGKIQNTTL